MRLPLMAVRLLLGRLQFPTSEFRTIKIRTSLIAMLAVEISLTHARLRCLVRIPRLRPNEVYSRVRSKKFQRDRAPVLIYMSLTAIRDVQ